MEFRLSSLCGDDDKDKVEAWKTAIDLINKGKLEAEKVKHSAICYYSLLSAKDMRALSWAWENVEALLDKKILDIDEVKGLKMYFFKLLKYASWVFSEVWDLVDGLATKGVITREDAEKFISLLKSYDEDVSSYAWEYVTVLLDRKILKPEEVIGVKDAFFQLLMTDDEEISLAAWNSVIGLVDKGIISPDQVRQYKGYFFQLLSGGWVSGYAWETVKDLIDRGIITKDEDRPFYSLLTSDSESVRLHAWENLDVLLNEGVLDLEEIKGLKEYLLGLMRSKSKFLRLDAWEVAVKVVSRGVLNLDDLIENKKYFLRLLKLGKTCPKAWGLLPPLIEYSVITEGDKDFFIDLLKYDKGWTRLRAWENVNTLLENSIIEFNDVLRAKRYFFDLLSSKDYEVRLAAWKFLAKNMNKGLITAEEVADWKDELRDMIVEAPNHLIRKDALEVYEELKANGII
ncbi:hypothetical protein [Stygiolobus caldivivus]|uniref:Uncharacterized protein n=1 Tax=Stygiolobus caldivivus TaxID=2824673 RepID=A0A8D5ZIV1_9CREN|nr:hypothetical protein [Stygiolobus caldivivus]BCU69720.1 hypothetical protein KN1_10170 [Stygiolobus caldivivus]